MSVPAAKVGEVSSTAKPRRRIGLFPLILSALLVGVVVGLFLGEYAGPLKLVGDAYIGLLQMTVLPYIVCTVTGNIGRLTLNESKRLAIAALVVMGALWGIGLGMVWLMSKALPVVDAGAFFSTSFVEPQKEFDFLSVFIPSNPFYSLSSNFIPAVVLFCVLLGLALMHMAQKETVIGLLGTMSAALSRVNTYIVRISPIGIFCISASAAGTVTLEEFGRLQAYFVVYIGSVLLLVLWVLPMLVSSLTPFRYRDLLENQGNVLITSFVVGSVFVVIPMLVESFRTLVAQYEDERMVADQGQVSSNPEFIVPLAYPFPHLGKIVTLIFIPFAAWFYGGDITALDYPPLLLTGLFLSFGKMTTTIPFLLDMQEIPTDIFQLFILSSVVAGRFNDLLGAAHLFAFTALISCAMSRTLAIDRFRLIWSTVATLVVIVVLIGLTQLVLRAAFADSFSRGNVIANMQMLQQKVPATILSVSEPNPVPLEDELTRLERVGETGKIRIGFSPDNLPFSYYNAQGELVGFDIDMAHRFAGDTGIEIEFVPFTAATLREQLLQDHFDVAMSGIEVNLGHASFARAIEPHINVNLALVVRDHERKQLADLQALREREPLTLGVRAGSYFARKIREMLPNARIVELWSESQFFEGPPQYMDALVTSAEGGSAWTLIHPEYAVVKPLLRNISVPVTYLVTRREEEMAEILSFWVRLKAQDGTIKSLYDYWILGRGTEAREPRWSILRDVLHWVE